MQITRRILALLSFAPAIVAAQQLPMDEPVPSMDVVRGVIQQVGETQNGWTVCFDTESVGTIREAAETALQARGIQGLPTPRQLVSTLRARYPCPFSPVRVKARPAEAKDLEGVWAMPEASDVLRYPPNSPQRKHYEEQTRAAPFRCLAVGYFPRGEVRQVEMRGASARCLADEKDFAAARAMPVVVRWRAAAGKLTLTRSDIADHVEEWDAFVVEETFEFAGLTLQAGDVLQYLRKFPGRDTDGYAIEFHHLQRLR